MAVLQARMSSSRLPGKVMMKINGQPMIYWQILRILESKRIDRLIVATSIDPTDDSLVDFLESKSVTVYRGSLQNVLSRFTEISSKFPCNALIRLTGDCPLVMPQLIDSMVEKFYAENVDYLSNTLELTFPDGLDVEILDSKVLGRLTAFVLDQKELEHVTSGIYKRPDDFNLLNFLNTSDQSAERWTVDYQEDIDFVRAIFHEFLGREKSFTYEDVMGFLNSHPKLRAKNNRHSSRGHYVRPANVDN